MSDSRLPFAIITSNREVPSRADNTVQQVTTLARLGRCTTCEPTHVTERWTQAVQQFPVRKRRRDGPREPHHSRLDVQTRRYRHGTRPRVDRRRWPPAGGNRPLARGDDALTPALLIPGLGTLHMPTRYNTLAD